ncbi:MAG TPA: CpaD family pilus assembly protein [Terricaulis sp.]|nr:CpaD family pilus assembly protein [Terricaulis sp.]
MNARLPLLLAGVAALSACAALPKPPPGPPTPTQADNHRINVTASTQRMEIPVAAGDMTLAPDARAELRSFASDYLRAGYGALVISTPTGGANSDAAALVGHETRMALTEAGVSYAAIAVNTHDGSGGAGPLVLNFERYVAQAPECESISTQNLAGWSNSNNQPWRSFGCATQANLAAMIEDPRDLLRARTEDPRDGARRSTVVDAYREGSRTHAERSQDERIQISNAAQ